MGGRQYWESGKEAEHLEVTGERWALCAQVLHQIIGLWHGRQEAGVGLHVSKQPGQLGQQHQCQAVHQKEVAPRQQKPADHVPSCTLAAGQRLGQHLHLAGLAPHRQSVRLSIEPATALCSAPS